MYIKNTLHTVYLVDANVPTRFRNVKNVPRAYVLTNKLLQMAKPI
jgi:hypothetical protein